MDQEGVRKFFGLSLSSKNWAKPLGELVTTSGSVSCSYVWSSSSSKKILKNKVWTGLSDIFNKRAWKISY